MRKIILHYHLFKNAGTSVDEMLKRNFNERWVTREFEGNTAAVQAQTAAWIVEQPEAVAFSSHTALLPPPKLEGVEVYPIIFVRHPIDRIASAYEFERKQGGDRFGAALARNTTLAGYIEVRLSMGHDRQCRNFHCARLAQMFKADSGSEQERALRAIDALPFVGLVESYNESIARMASWLKPHFAEIEPIVVARNVTRDISLPILNRLEGLRSSIGSKTFDRVFGDNLDDIKVFETVQARLADQQSGS